MIGSFGVYRPPLNSLWSARACFGDCIALLLSPFWEPLGPLWVTLGSFGTHFGTPGDALGSLGGAVGASWGSIGHLVPQETPSQTEGSQVPRLRTKTSLLEFARWSRGSRRSRRNGPRTTVQDLPSTRAGDQDDVSFKQTPSNKASSIKLHMPQEAILREMV